MSRAGKFFMNLLIFAVALLIICTAANIFVVWKTVKIPKTKISSTPEDLLFEYENVEFTTPDGVKLSGWYIKGKSKAPVIVGCHNFGSNKEYLLNSIIRLNKVGYNIFLFDFRGHGESAGASSMGIEGKKDVIGALDYLQTEKDFERKEIGIWAVGSGAFASVLALKDKKGIKALVLDSVYPSVDFYLNYRIEQKFNLDIFPGFSNKLIFSAITTSFQVPDIKDAVGKLEDTILFYLISKKQPEFADRVMELYRSSPDANSNLQKMPSTKFTGLEDDEKENYDEAVLSFFESYLPPKAKKNKSLKVITE